MTLDVGSAALFMFKVGEGYAPYFLLAYPTALLIAYAAARASRKWTRRSTRWRAALAVGIASVVVAAAHIAFLKAYIDWYPLDPGCPSEEHRVIYRPLFSDAALATRLEDWHYRSRTTCDQIYSLIQQSGYGWWSYGTIVVHMFLGALLIGLLGFLIFSLQKLNFSGVFDAR